MCADECAGKEGVVVGVMSTKGEVCGGGGEKHTAEQTEDEAERGCILAKGVYCIPFPIELETCGRGLEARNKSSLNLRYDPKKRTKLIGDSGPHGVENLHTEVHSAGGTADVSGNSGCVQFCVVRLVR